MNRSCGRRRETARRSLETYYRTFLGVWCLGAAYASVAQLGLQELGARGSNWGYTPGWQREIGFWNIGLIAVLIPILRRGTADLQVAAIRALVLLSTLFGTNHAIEVFRGGNVNLAMWSHVGGWAENYLAVAMGAVLLLITWRRTASGAIGPSLTSRRCGPCRSGPVS